MSKTPRSAPRLVLLVALVVVALVASALLVYRVRDDGSDSGALQSQRDKVMSVGRQFMLAINTYDPSMLDDQNQMPDYRKAVSALITPKFQASFDQSVGFAEQTVKSGLARTSKVFSTGVKSMDADSATVLVAGSYTNSYPTKKGKRVDDEPAPFRVEISLQHIGSQWLVDDFNPVTDPADEVATPSASPSPSASGGAS